MMLSSAQLLDLVLTVACVGLHVQVRLRKSLMALALCMAF